MRKAKVHRSCLSVVFILLVLCIAVSMPPITPVSAASSIVWSADMESGDLSQWLSGGVSQASYDSGNCTRPKNGVSTDFAHSGSYSMKMTIDTSSVESGCRQFRSVESKTGGTYYYGAWYYLPTNYQAASYWNIFQFKSNNGSTEDPFWVIDLLPRSDGTLHLRLRWKEGHPGPYASSGTSKSPVYFDQTIKAVPLNHWFHIEAYLVQSSNFGGHLTVWQDDMLLWDLADINTKFSGGDERWSTNNYSDKITPTPTSLYVDDATVSTQRVGSPTIEPPTNLQVTVS